MINEQRRKAATRLINFARWLMQPNKKVLLVLAIANWLDPERKSDIQPTDTVHDRYQRG